VLPSQTETPASARSATVVSRQDRKDPIQTTRTSSTAPAATGPTCPEVQPVSHESLDRSITAIVCMAPFVAIGLAGWQLWDHLLRWQDLAIFVLVYLLTGLGVTVGFHRYLTHRSFETGRVVRGIVAALGSAAIEGPVIAWVADHRKHHAYSDEEGDPHSPHVGHGGGIRGTLRGLAHAHMAWLFLHTHRGSKERYASDLLRDPVIGFIDRTFLLWAVIGLAVPFGLGVALGGTVSAGLTALLWGGGVRMFVVHHVTYSVNSLCHVFGRQRFRTRDESRNLSWLALPTLGEAWHNNHHAFPTSALHGLGRLQVDPSGIVIRGLERLGLVWNVVRVSPERQHAASV
jgi:stearoyl-CoA desaturase (delta-9 desaturase)